MDEQTIAQKVAQNIPRPAPEPTSDVPQEPSQPDETGYVQKLDDTQFNSYLYDYFEIQGISKYDDGTKSQVNLVQRWAYDTAQTTDHVKALQAIQALENELGTTFRTDKLQRLARFIELKQKSTILQMQMDAVKGGSGL